ncbi:UDP-GalNAc:beta-1,3-N-acetylgalactosaminyltransferase 2 [Armadillidium vulgare]|nr:UDP-GalNAc:beta-1,3-N-acetylgalactosaminyltransferase 2 [Armadillidium vulgare]
MLKLDNLICRSVSQGVATLHDAKTCYSGFGFRVFHSLFLTSIGVRFEYFQELENFEIIFRDAEEVFEKIHVFKNDCLNTLNGFCFINLKEKFLLPKDFEGSVMMSHSKEISLNSTKEFCEWNSDGNFFLTFGIIGNLYERYHEGRCSNLIANFSLQDPDAVKDHNNLKAKRNAEWTEEENIIDNDLYKEMKTNDDLVYLHNVIDVYRNLPSKILEVIKWSNGNYPSSYLLKVDDDTNVNIHFLMDWMTQKIKAPRSLTLHSNFHYHREVPMFGKWADFDFQGLTYPPFPSGSGYLLSDRLVYLLSMQAPFMRHFQGEDVSMGIWTQVLRLGQDIVEKKHVSCWLPSTSCNQSIIIPEIIPNPVISIER